MSSAPLVSVQDLRVWYPRRKRSFKKEYIKAVDGVSFDIRPGETLALVGESGSGKTTVSRAVLGLMEPTDGRVEFQGKPLSGLSRRGRKDLRRQVQAVFQNPYTSLNPRRRVVDIVAEPLRVHRVASESEVETRITELLEAVGLDPSHRHRYPHEFSGGQRQRIAIARALALNPSLIVCDEPVSGLDVSVQANIINLLKKLQDELGIALLFVSHDLGVVRSIAHEVAVMYLGRIVEMSPADEVYESPKHPYTVALLASVLSPLPSVERARAIMPLRGSAASPSTLPTGCHFAPRCPHRQPVCDEVPPSLLQVGPDHTTACHLYGVLAESQASDV